MFEADYIQSGKGSTVVLLHATATGAKQWWYLMEEFSDRYHFIAVNLFGYGKTPGWNLERAQSLSDQVSLLDSIPQLKRKKFSIVGHSFGGSVAMKAARILGDQVEKLILLEPNPFYLLKQKGQTEAFQEALVIRDTIKRNYHKDWNRAAHYFLDYWNGKGSWNSYSIDQREKFSNILRPNFFEWDAVLDEETPIKDWDKYLPNDTSFISSINTVNSIVRLKDLFKLSCSGWSFEEISYGGHMAPLTHAKEVSSLIIRALST